MISLDFAFDGNNIHMKIIEFFVRVHGDNGAYRTNDSITIEMFLSTQLTFEIVLNFDIFSLCPL